MFGSTTPKIYYATQVSAQPPTLVLMCNQPRAFSPTYRRYLLGALREHLPFAEVPIKLYLRKRQAGDTRAEIDSDTESSEAVVTQIVEPVDDSESVREG